MFSRPVLRRRRRTSVERRVHHQRQARFVQLSGPPATLALDKGVSAHVVADILGHHDVAFTLRTYGHLLPRAHSEAMNAVGNLIFGPSTTENVTSGVT